VIDRWRELSPGERLQTQALIAFVLVAMYGLVLFPVTHGKYQESKNMLHRRQDRIEKRAGSDDLGHGSINPQVVISKIKKVDEQLKEVTAAFDELDTGFAPVDSSDVRQQLMLEISTLAARTGVELLSVSRKETVRGNQRIIAPVDPDLGRPLLVVTANARFGQLLDFLYGLKELSFYVSVMNLKVGALQTKGDGGALERDLSVTLEMSM
jgi:hypothetical protein